MEAGRPVPYTRVTRRLCREGPVVKKSPAATSVEIFGLKRIFWKSLCTVAKECTTIEPESPGRGRATAPGPCSRVCTQTGALKSGRAVAHRSSSPLRRPLRPSDHNPPTPSPPHELVPLPLLPYQSGPTVPDDPHDHVSPSTLMRRVRPLPPGRGPRRTPDSNRSRVPNLHLTSVGSPLTRT